METKNKLYLPTVFETELQTKIVETLLQNPEESYTLSEMARLLDATSSGIKRCIVSLQEHGYVMVRIHSTHCYLFALNTEHQLIKALLPFYQRLKTIMEVSKQKTREIPDNLKMIENHFGNGEPREK